MARHQSATAGTIPTSWSEAGSFPALSDVWLLNLPLAGTLPPMWGTNLAALSSLQLQLPLLSGTLPAEWGNLASFQQLQILSLNGCNNLTGEHLFLTCTR